MEDKETKELIVIPPHASHYLRSIINIGSQQLKEEDIAEIEVPTLLARAKAFVNKKGYLALLTTKKDK